MSKKRIKLTDEFNKVRKSGKMLVQQYIDALHAGIEKGISGQEYTLYAGGIFSVFLIDLNFGNIRDAVFARGDTASLRIFKKEMQRLLRQNGTPETHHLLMQ